jgi:hypothetical protein
MDRLAVLEELTRNMPSEFASSMLSIEKDEGEAGAALELAALMAWITAAFLKPDDESWFKNRLANIRSRGIHSGDEAFLKVAQSNVDISALAELIRQSQRDAVASFFTLHSGASGEPCESMPELRLLLCHGRRSEDFTLGDVKPFPNWIDEYYCLYASP